MGKPQSTGNLVNAIAQDSSNNIGIGGAANASFKLQVTGSVNLEGNVTTTGAQFVQNGFYLTNANGGSAAGYTNMWGATDGIFFGLRNGTGGGKFIFQSATSYDYTFPAATGTLALTSNLSAYLPLTGGTLTGALSGTSAYFSSTLDVRGEIYVAYNATYGLRFYNDARSNWSSIGNTITGSAAANLVFKTGNGTALTLDNSGAATFSSSVTASGDISYYNGANLNAIITSGAAANGRMYIYSSASADIGFQAGGSSWFTNSLGVGTNSPSEKLHISSSASSTEIRIENSTTSAYIRSQTDNLNFYFNGAERMRITSGGDVLVGTTSNGNSSKLVLYGGASTNTLECVHTGTADTFNLIFTNGNGLVGSIRTSGSTTTYYTTSDYRLKQDFKDYDGLNLVSAIKTYDYEWKSDKTRMYGVVAHELQEVLPYAVAGEKDGELMQQIDYSKIVPLLVKAIQELNERIKQLENK
jgi:hypothetical protein